MNSIMHRRAGTPNALGIPLRIRLALSVNMLTLGHKRRNFDPRRLALISNIPLFYYNKSYPMRQVEVKLDLDV